jgi:hypothetical protein
LEGCCSTIELHPRREQSSDVVDQVERLSETDLCFSRDGGGGSYHPVEALQWVAPRCGRFGPFDPQPLFLMAPAPSGSRRMSDYWPEPVKRKFERQTFAPIPNFTGLFDGQGQTIANLTIASTTQNIGLFGTIASAGEVRNLNLTNVQFERKLAIGWHAGGNDAGTISNVSATGQVQVGSGSTAGGLVGQNLRRDRAGTDPALHRRPNLRGGRGERGGERQRRRPCWLQQRDHHECVRNGRRHRGGRKQPNYNAGRARRSEPHLEFARLWRRGKSERCQPSGRRLGRQQFRYNPVIYWRCSQ